MLFVYYFQLNIQLNALLLLDSTWVHALHTLIDLYLLCTPSDPARFQDTWRLSDGFVATEAKVILPHRARSR